MKKIDLFVVVALLLSLIGGSNLTFAQEQLTAAQKIQLIEQLRGQVSAKKSEVTGAKAQYLNGQLYYQIGDIGATITGWTAFLVALGGQTLDPKTRTGKIFWGTLAGYAVTKVMEVHFKEVVNISQADKDRLEKELSGLEQRLIGLEAGLTTLNNIK